MSDGAVAGIVIGGIVFYLAMIVTAYEARVGWLGKRSRWEDGYVTLDDREVSCLQAIFWPGMLVWYIGYLLSKLVRKITDGS